MKITATQRLEQGIPKDGKKRGSSLYLRPGVEYQAAVLGEDSEQGNKGDIAVTHERGVGVLPPKLVEKMTTLGYISVEDGS